MCIVAFTKAVLVASISIGLAAGQTAPALPDITQAVEAKPTPTHIGAHQLGETLQEWLSIEKLASPQKTNIAPHRLGETFAEWLKFNQMDLDGLCPKNKPNDGLCNHLLQIRDTGSGDLYTTDQFSRTLGWRFIGGKVADYSFDHTWQNERVTTSNNRAYKWQFSDEQLSAVSVTPDWNTIYKQYSEEGIARHPEAVPAFQEEVGFLTQTYGSPSKVETIPYGNAYGAHWERSEAVWNRPDGTKIIAFERTGFNQQGQLELVAFDSKTSLEKAQQTKPNPYGH